MDLRGRHTSLAMAGHQTACIRLQSPFMGPSSLIIAGKRRMMTLRQKKEGA
jgi:hypothetical protein